MASIHLYTPQQTLASSAFIDVRPRRVQAWLAELPQANPARTGQLIRSALVEVNKVRMSIEQRYEVMSLFVPVVERLARGLEGAYRGKAFPPTDAALESINLLQQIDASMANACKILVSELQRSGKRMSADNALFMAAMAGGMDYLSLQLLQAYEVHFPEPKRAWGELHFLYLLARRQGVHEVPTAFAAHGSMTLQGRYKRILMLALANPYHLNQGDARQLYDKLGAWTGYCKLTQGRSRQVPAGCFFVDMGNDVPPRYVPAGMNLSAAYPFLIDPGGVIEVLDAQINDLKPGSDTANEAVGDRLSEHKLRATLERAAHAWGGRAERADARTRAASESQMLLGLSTCYRLFRQISPGMDSAVGSEAEGPEADHGAHMRLMDIEEHIQQAEASLEALEKELGDFAGVWGADIESEEAEHQLVESVSLDGLDNDHIFKNGADVAPVAESDASRWRQRDCSRGGLSLFSLKKLVGGVQVGEVIAVRVAQAQWNRGWKVGTVRWLRINPGQGLEMGVRIVSADAAAVRTRAVIGAASSAQSAQSLLVPRVDPRQQSALLITPPAIYDEGAVLAVELAEDEVIAVRLEALVEASDRYAQFRFRCMERPPRISGWDVMG